MKIYLKMLNIKTSISKCLKYVLSSKIIFMSSWNPLKDSLIKKMSKNFTKQFLLSKTEFKNILNWLKVWNFYIKEISSIEKSILWILDSVIINLNEFFLLLLKTLLLKNTMFMNNIHQRILQKWMIIKEPEPLLTKMFFNWPCLLQLLK